MDIDLVITLHSTQSLAIPQQEYPSMTENYTVVWNGTQDSQLQKARQRPAPTLSERYAPATLVRQAEAVGLE
jgi:hypothetical protein